MVRERGSPFAPTAIRSGPRKRARAPRIQKRFRYASERPEEEEGQQDRRRRGCRGRASEASNLLRHRDARAATSAVVPSQSDPASHLGGESQAIHEMTIALRCGYPASVRYAAQSRSRMPPSQSARPFSPEEATNAGHDRSPPSTRTRTVAPGAVAATGETNLVPQPRSPLVKRVQMRSLQPGKETNREA